MPQISVIIPTYKHRQFITATLDSVFAQTLTDYEVIVVNDGSPDDTSALLRPLAEQRRIRYLEQPNAGQSKARNRGLAEAQGEFVAFLDDDDLWPANKLEWQVEALRQNPSAALAYGYSEQFGEVDMPAFPGPDAPTGNVRQAFLRDNWMWSPGQTLMRTDAVRQIGGFDEKLWGADDWDLWIRLSERGEFVYCHQPALRYRLHAGNASKNYVKMYANVCKVRRKHGAAWYLSWNIASKPYSAQAVSEAERQMSDGDWRQAKNLWGQAIRIRPTLLRHRHVWSGYLKSVLLCARPQQTDA